jgi:F0F1-type ATP synthase delta subunit
MNSKQTILIWTRVLVEACLEKTATEQKKIILRLEEILKRKKKEYLLPRIIKKAFAIMEGRSKMELTLAHSQSPETIDKLTKKLAKHFDGWDEIKTAVDTGIIGGFVAKTEEYIFNASVRNYLDQLKKKYGNQ